MLQSGFLLSSICNRGLWLKVKCLTREEFEKSGPIDRTQPGLPMKKGRAGTTTHDYKPRPESRFAPDLYGAFPVKRLFWVVLTVFCSERERPFFVL